MTMGDGSQDSEKTRCAGVLIIEDEKDIRETLQQVLELEGYRVMTAANGKQGLELLGQIRRPCLILLDLMMPVMNGWEFLQEQKEDVILATIPVVIVSAAGDRAKLIQANGFVKKPVDLDGLLSVVRKFCGEPELTDADRSA